MDVSFDRTRGWRKPGGNVMNQVRIAGRPPALCPHPLSLGLERELIIKWYEMERRKNYFPVDSKRHICHILISVKIRAHFKIDGVP